MFDLSLPLLLSTFGVIFLAELPDKTTFAALILATKFNARQVVIGVWLAFLVQTLIAVLAGSLLTLLPALPVHIAAGLGFLVFAYLTLRKDPEEEEKEEELDVSKVARSKRPAWITSFLVIFAAEWGDLSQLATAAIIAHSGHPFSVGVGAVLALWSVTLLAVLAGTQVHKYLKPRTLTLVSGIVLGLIGLAILVTALLGIA